MGEWKVLIKDMVIKNWKNFFISAALSILIVVILWVTLLSRFGSYTHHFYPPFWSYRAVLNGSMKALLENIENIVLFIPVGISIALFFKLDVNCYLLIGAFFRCLLNVANGSSG